MDKIIQTLLLWNTSQTAGRTSGKAQHHLVCLQKGIATAGESICSRFPRKPLGRSQNISEKRNPSTPRLTGLLVATSGRAPGAWPRAATGNRLRADLQRRGAVRESGWNISSWGITPLLGCCWSLDVSVHSWQHPQESLWASLQHFAAASVKEFLSSGTQYWKKIHSIRKKIQYIHGKYHHSPYI